MYCECSCCPICAVKLLKKSSKSSQPSKSGSKHNNSDNSNKELNKMDMTALTIATELFGERKIATIPLHLVFIAKLEFLCDVVPISVEIIKLLQSAVINLPHKLINQFGRTLGGLSQQLCYM